MFFLHNSQKAALHVSMLPARNLLRRAPNTGKHLFPRPPRALSVRSSSVFSICFFSSVFADLLPSHVKKCNAVPKAPECGYKENFNAEPDCSDPASQLFQVPDFGFIQRVYLDLLMQLDASPTDSHVDTNLGKHHAQNESLRVIIQNTVKSEAFNMVEFGAGKAALSAHLQASGFFAKRASKWYLVDRSNSRRKVLEIYLAV